MFNIEKAVPKSELYNRIDKLKSFLDKKNIEGALIVQNSDLFYFAGTIQQSHLYIPVDGDPVLMVKKNIDRARAESSIGHIVPIASPGKIPSILKDYNYNIPKTLGMEMDVVPANNYLKYRSVFDKSEIVDISHYIRTVRSAKSDYEIGILREAAKRSDRLAEAVPAFLDAGITEIELAGKIEAKAREMGHQGIIRMRLWGSELFYGHVMSGPAAAVPSFLSSPTGGTSVTPAVAQGPGYGRIEGNVPVLVDIAFAYDGYITDHTRIFSLGELPEDLVKAHNAMLEVQSLIKNRARPSVKAGDIYSAALEHADSLGYGEFFMGYGKDRVRFVGHGIGIELDEYPFLAEDQKFELQKNMTLALEPKLIFPGRGVVGIENSFIVTDNGLEQLTLSDENIIVL